MVKYKDVFKKKEKYIRPILHPKKKAYADLSAYWYSKTF